MVVPLELDPGRHDPRSPFYEGHAREGERRPEPDYPDEPGVRGVDPLVEARAVAGPEPEPVDGDQA